MAVLLASSLLAACGATTPSAPTPGATTRGTPLPVATLPASPAAAAAETFPASTSPTGAPPASAATAAVTPSGSGGGATARPGGTASPAGTLPNVGHVYLIVMENRGLAAIEGNPAAPYLNGLMARYGLATQYRGVAHPSEPNYLALFSGSTQGVTDDGVHEFAAPTIADQLEAAGRTWRVFAENVPLPCFQGAVATGGPDGQGTYARKHEPAISFRGIAGDPARCARITDFSHFDPAAADFELIIPNMCNDMHDCSTATGDRFLASFVPRILGSAAWRQGGALFITWDEGSGNEPVATLVISPDFPAGFRSAVPHDHYSLLRTIEDLWGLPCLANTCRVSDMREFFRPPAGS